jgi:hypothetical protein
MSEGSIPRDFASNPQSAAGNATLAGQATNVLRALFIRARILLTEMALALFLHHSKEQMQ